MRTTHHAVWAAASVAAVLSVSSILTAGPLAPPPGPVAPTPEIEPRTAVNSINTPGDNDASPSLFKITQPGSYYLTGNVSGVAGMRGIEIASSGVTLDLMGFEILGVPGSLDGIAVSSFSRNVRIHNGSVRDWGLNGVGAGLAINAILRDLAAIDNGFNGLQAGEGALVESCVAQSNGFDGIVANAGSTVRACSTSFNTGDGVNAASASTVTGCTARNNGGDGISAGAGSTVAGCTARGNGDDGVVAASSSTVRGCTAFLNSGDGIQVPSDSFVVGNTCDSNGLGVADGAGIHATSTDNRVEGNTVTDNDRGIDIDSSGNLVIRNSASGNTINYAIAANNRVGLIVNAPNSLAINGSTGGAGVGTTRPWGNISF